MNFSVGKILGIGNGYNTGLINKIEAIQPQNFIQTAITAGQNINLNQPEHRNSTPYGDSPNGKHLYYLA